MAGLTSSKRLHGLSAALSALSARAVAVAEVAYEE